MPNDPIKLDFVVKGYPGSGRRAEDELDLVECISIDLFFTAFMGDAIFEVGGKDFSTPFGWVTLLSWTAGLRRTVSRLQTGPQHIAFLESADYVSLTAEDSEVLVSCSYAPGLGRVGLSELARSVDAFIDAQKLWLEERYPQVFDNREDGPRIKNIFRALGESP